MSKNIFKLLALSAVVMGALTSCEFDQYPDTSIPSEQSWKEVRDAQSYNIGLLAYIRSVSGGDYATISEAQADLFNETTANVSGGLYEQVQQWTFTNASFAGDKVWSGNYSLISAANNIVNNIDQIPAATADERHQLDYYKASAYFARALGYDNLAHRYCKAYDPATAANTIGLPLVTEVDVTAKPTRASLEATYALIKADIAQAKALMQYWVEAGAAAMETYEVSYNAIRALEARVSLECGDYQTAIDCANELVDQYPLAQTTDELSEMWESDEGSEIIFQPVQTKDERANPYSAFIGFNSTQTKYYANYLPSQGLIDLYEDGDIRLKSWYLAPGVATTDVIDERAVILYKFPGNPALVKTSAQTEFYNMTKVFRAAELYLIAAEASYRLSGTEGGYLNALRQARGASTLNLSGDNLFQEIQNEWAREMCGEGYRLDCLKRWHKGFKRMDTQDLAAGFFRTQTGYQGLEISADNAKFVWEIPVNDLQNNKNLERNWK